MSDEYAVILSLGRSVRTVEDLRCQAVRLGRDIAEMLGVSYLATMRARLAQGAMDYGPLDCVGDKRDWLKEALEEAVDLAVYLECEIRRRNAK